MGRLLPNHFSRSPLIMPGVAIWFLAPFNCTYVNIVGPLVFGGAAGVSKMSGGMALL